MWGGAGVVGCGWGAGGGLEGSSYLLPDVLIVGGQTPCFAEVAYHTCSVVYVPGCLKNLVVSPINPNDIQDLSFEVPD